MGSRSMMADLRMSPEIAETNAKQISASDFNCEILIYIYILEKYIKF